MATAETRSRVPQPEEPPTPPRSTPLPSLGKWPGPPPGHSHLYLPDTDGEIVDNIREHPQSAILTDSIMPVVRRLHPDGHYVIGQDCGIYWRLTDPPLRGCKAPDWFYVPNVPPLASGSFRRSYVLWDEGLPPAVILEYASGDGSEERDRTPWSGKFWVYERILQTAFYAIFAVESGELEVFHHVEGAYRPYPPNERGRFPIPHLGVELGVWTGQVWNETAPWMRWWDQQGRLLPTSEELVEMERRRAEEADQRAEAERRRIEALAAKLRELGINPDEV